MNKKILIWLLVSVITITVMFGMFKTSNTLTQSQKITPPVNNASTLPPPTTDSWDPEIMHLRERLNAMGLSVLTEEGTTLHTHQHLDIFIHGKTIPVPADIGVNEKEKFISPIHTHENDQVIHIESPDIKDFTLGQFFDVWGLHFTQTCIGAYCKDTKNDLTVFVNGNKISGDPRLIILQQHQEIAIIYGTPEETPKNIPSLYLFTKGE